MEFFYAPLHCVTFLIQKERGRSLGRLCGGITAGFSSGVKAAWGV